jgi:Uracil-DNA glycosylase
MTGKRVPNKFPKHTNPRYRIAVVGEAPGKDEEIVGEPFVGYSGRLLRGTLGQLNVSLDECLVANVCQFRPDGNDISDFDWDSPEFEDGRQLLQSDLQTFQPNVILSLGRTPFRFFRPDLCYPLKKGYAIPIQDWRGSILHCHNNYKVVPTFHPAYILRQPRDILYFRQDIQRCVQQAHTPEVPVITRDLVTRPTLTQVIEFIGDLRLNHTPASIDLEGYPDDTGITMFGIAPSPTRCLVIPFWINGRHYWSEDEEPIVWKVLADYMADPNCPKTAHSNAYEVFVSAWRHRMLICNLDDDTRYMFKELHPEAESNLGVVSSFCTLEPYYKDERTSGNTEVKLVYNAKDCCVTQESKAVLLDRLRQHPASYDHYRFNIRINPAINYLNLRGCKFDTDRAQQHILTETAALAELQSQIDAALVEPALAAGVLTRKRKSDPWSFNVKSADQKKWLLYSHFGFKPGRRGETSEEGELLRHYVKSRQPILKTVIQAVRKRTRISDIQKLVLDPDGRIRTSLDLVGTDTFRLASRSAMSMLPDYKADGSLREWVNTGTNLQNVTKELRDCFIPDSPEYDFWQFDLAGADAWTVAADLAALGYPAMLEDLLAGIKPAKVLMLLLGEYEAGRNPALLNALPRADLKRLTKELVIPEGRDAQGRPGDWKYLVCKKAQHGTNYDGSSATVAELVFEDSDGLVDLTASEASIYQQLYKLRYKPEKRIDWIRSELRDKGYLVTAAGVRRKFNGIRNPRDPEDSVVREAAAFEPQCNTTYATNRALERLWYDPANRQSTGWLHVEPLLQIHDALAGQYHSAARAWAHEKLRSYFNNPMMIHGIPVTIPADGGWGENWKNTKHELL